MQRLAIGLLLLILAAGIVPQNWQDIRQREQRQGWQSTTGQVLSASVVLKPVYDNDGGYSPIIEYAYYADGVYYIHQEQRISQQAYALDSAERTAQHYPPGQVVTVLYNPADPSQAQLVPRVTAAQILLVIMGITAGVTGGILCLSHFFQRMSGANPHTIITH